MVMFWLGGTARTAAGRTSGRAAPRLNPSLTRLTAPVATTAHLIALKALAGRSQDRTDLGNLISAAAPDELAAARNAAKLIQNAGSTGSRMSSPT
jgi:hypothetical protein